MDNNIAQTAPSVEQAGNMEFEAIITAHESVLLRYVARLVNDVNAAQDVVQETFIKLFRVWWNDARPTDNLRPWLYRVAHNTAIDYIRRESRLHRLHEREALERSAPDPADPADPPDRVHIVLDHVHRLDQAEKQVLLLRMQEGLSYREISLITGRTEGNIGCILHHAVKKISVSLRNAGLIRKGGLP